MPTARERQLSTIYDPARASVAAKTPTATATPPPPPTPPPPTEAYQPTPPPGEDAGGLFGGAADYFARQGGVTPDASAGGQDLYLTAPPDIGEPTLTAFPEVQPFTPTAYETRDPFARPHDAVFNQEGVEATFQRQMDFLRPKLEWENKQAAARLAERIGAQGRVGSARSGAWANYEAATNANYGALMSKLYEAATDQENQEVLSELAMNEFALKQYNTDYEFRQDEITEQNRIAAGAWEVQQGAEQGRIESMRADEMRIWEDLTNIDLSIWNTLTDNEKSAWETEVRYGFDVWQEVNRVGLAAHQTAMDYSMRLYQHQNMSTAQAAQLDVMLQELEIARQTGDAQKYQGIFGGILELGKTVSLFTNPSPVRV